MVLAPAPAPELLRWEAWELLSVTQRQVAVCLVNGLSIKETVRALGANFNTIRVHHVNIHAKLGVSTRQQLLRALVHIPWLACDQRSRITITGEEPPNDLS